MGSSGSGDREERLAPEPGRKLDNEELLVQILRPDLTDGQKVQLLKDNMPTESMSAGRSSALTRILDGLGRGVDSDSSQVRLGEVADMMRKFAPLVFDPTRPEPRAMSCGASCRRPARAVSLARSATAP